jgi:hypothetical protein
MNSAEDYDVGYIFVAKKPNKRYGFRPAGMAFLAFKFKKA